MENFIRVRTVWQSRGIVSNRGRPFERKLCLVGRWAMRFLVHGGPHGRASVSPSRAHQVRPWRQQRCSNLRVGLRSKEVAPAENPDEILLPVHTPLDRVLHLLFSPLLSAFSLHQGFTVAVRCITGCCCLGGVLLLLSLSHSSGRQPQRFELRREHRPPPTPYHVSSLFISPRSPSLSISCVSQFYYLNVPPGVALCMISVRSSSELNPTPTRLSIRRFSIY